MNKILVQHPGDLLFGTKKQLRVSSKLSKPGLIQISTSVDSHTLPHF